MNMSIIRKFVYLTWLGMATLIIQLFPFAAQGTAILSIGPSVGMSYYGFGSIVGANNYEALPNALMFDSVASSYFRKSLVIGGAIAESRSFSSRVFDLSADMSTDYRISAEEAGDFAYLEINQSLIFNVTNLLNEAYTFLFRVGYDFGGGPASADPDAGERLIYDWTIGLSGLGAGGPFGDFFGEDNRVSFCTPNLYDYFACNNRYDGNQELAYIDFAPGETKQFSAFTDVRGVAAVVVSEPGALPLVVAGLMGLLLLARPPRDVKSRFERTSPRCPPSSAHVSAESSPPARSWCDASMWQGVRPRDRYFGNSGPLDSFNPF